MCGNITHMLNFKLGIVGKKIDSCKHSLMVRELH